VRRLLRVSPALLLVVAVAAAGASGVSTAGSGSAAAPSGPDTSPSTVGAPASSSGAPFAALTVTPDGAQSYDISTGVTTLPDGGTVIDQDTGVRLHAKRLTYVDGAYIDASTVTVSGAFGTLTADKLHIDVPKAVLTASGDLALTRHALRLTAVRLTYDAGRQVADFTGPVTGAAPDFQASRLLLDAASGNVLLVGDYRYASGPLTLTAPEGGGRLELKLHQVNGSPVYDAATDVSSELLARFAAELN